MMADSNDDDSEESDYLSNVGDDVGEDVDVHLNHYRIPKLSEYRPNGARNPPKGCGNGDQVKHTNEGKLVSLIELAAQKVACHLPFGQVEHFHPPVPEPMQCRIAFWSFPQDEEDIRLYTCLANGNADVFMRAEDLISRNSVCDMLQVGFHLSANVQFLNEPNNLESFTVAITFDRRRITSCSCSCLSTTFWCQHAVAVCLQRIRRPNEVTLRAPVSESLQRLEKKQLQKFAQYLINELPQQILPAAQKLLDELLSGNEAIINQNPGAPDPTAGATINEQTSWCLDYNHLSLDIQKILLKQCTAQPTVCDVQSLHITAPPASTEYSQLLRPIRGREPEGLWNLISIVGEMMKRRDSNFLLLLEIMTEEVLKFDKIATWWFETKVSLLSGSTIHLTNNKSSQNTSQYSCSNFCDEIVHLWRLAALNPSLNETEKKKLYDKFFDWHLSILKRFGTVSEYYASSNIRSNRSKFLGLFPGFKLAMEATLIKWDDWDDKQAKIIEPNQVKGDPMNQDGIENVQSAKSTKKKKRKFKSKQAPPPSEAQDVADEPTPSTSAGTTMATDDNPTPKDVLMEVNTENDGHSINGAEVSSAQPEPLKPLDMNSRQNSPANREDSGIEQDLQVYYMDREPEDSTLEQKMETLEESIVVNQRRLDDSLETLYAKAEGLHAHGHSEEARKLAARVANDILAQENYPSYKQLFISQKRNKRKNGLGNLGSVVSSEALSKVTFLCSFLMEDVKNYDLVFRLALFGVKMKGTPASIKPLEVKFISQKQEILLLLKNIILSAEELNALRDLAKSLIDSISETDLDALTVLMLGNYIFEALVLSKSPLCPTCSRSLADTSRNNTNANESNGSHQSESSDSGCTSSSQSSCDHSRYICSVLAHGKQATDEDLGFEAALNALGVKVNIREIDHPLLCEGIRRQRGDLAISLLSHYKDDQEKLDLILKHLFENDVILSASRTTKTKASSYTTATTLSSSKKILPLHDPNHPTEASAHFMFELAKTVFDKAGGNSLTAHLFRPQLVAQNGGRDIHHKLHMCTLRIAIYALGLHNRTSNNWMYRTYSGRASFIHEQALEIGLPAIKYLRDNWEGYLTPVEAATIADKAGCSTDTEMKRVAAEMAKSCVKWANYLDLNSVSRILAQCKDQSTEMLVNACNEIEKVAENGSVCADVLFVTSRAWYDLYLKTLETDKHYDAVNYYFMPQEQDTGASNWSCQQTVNMDFNPNVYQYAQYHPHQQQVIPQQNGEPIFPMHWDMYARVDYLPQTHESCVDYRMAAFRVGIKALEALKLSSLTGGKHNPKKMDEILWLLELSKFLNRDCLHEFSRSAIQNISDPHILKTIILDLYVFLDTLQEHTNIINILLPIVDKCLDRCINQARDFLKLNNHKFELEAIFDVAQQVTEVAGTFTAIDQFKELLSIVDNRRTKKFLKIDTKNRHIWVHNLRSVIQRRLNESFERRKAGVAGPGHCGIPGCRGMRYLHLKQENLN